MAYWSSGSEGADWEAVWCERCVHRPEETECPVMELHSLWNYAQCRDDDIGATKKFALDTLIPESSQQCRMFHPRTSEDQRAERERKAQAARDLEWLRTKRGSSDG